ncbi:prepilin peptidase [Vibrio fluvialis]|nr:prepilin peptidase [Vibrio fluvialis]MBY7869707.1 prepilin peptidase [Vibrio fluvialis]MBY8094100.1 prepilin peptidase [Vibrio fluvialis]
MEFGILVWGVLVVIGVSDAKEHRIPNKLVLVLLGGSITQLTVLTISGAQMMRLGNHISGFALALVVGLILYFPRFIAAGDVKLIAVLGLLVGVSELIDYTFFVGISIVVIGPMYWLLNRLQQHTLILKSDHRVTVFSASIALYDCSQRLRHSVMLNQNLTYMPFAPILVIAFAMHQYFLH